MWWGVKEVAREGDVNLVRDVALVGNVITEGHNRWQWKNGAVGTDCCCQVRSVYANASIP